MRKTGLALLLMIFGIVSYSQSRFGIFAGGQASTTKYSVNDDRQSTGHKYGFQAGFGWKIPFESHLFFSPAAFYSLKGYKVTLKQPSFPPDTLAINNNTSVHTFEVAFLFQVDLGENPNHLFIKAGPSFDFQLVGKEKFTLKNGGLVNRNMAYGFADYGRYLVNMLFQLGFESKSGFTIFGQYTTGLVNLNNADYGPRIYYRVYGISIGKYFNQKKIVLDTRNRE